jgi:RHS repeat-associated protein
MAGISSKAIGKLENRFKFNDGTELENKEFSDGSGLELYDTKYRIYDPQTGRFNRMDPLADIFNELTPYNFSYNNPIRFNDRFGLSPNGVNDPDLPKNELKGDFALKGWIQGGGGKVFFDRRVHSQEDVKKFGLQGTYLGEEILIKDANGKIIGYGNDQGGVSYNVNLNAVTVTAKRPGYDNYNNNPFRQVSSYRHWSGTTINRYVTRLSDGDALRFFGDLKDYKKQQLGGDGVAFIPMNYYLSIALAGLGLLGDKQISAIEAEYSKTGDKLGIKVKIENIIDASTGNTWNYSISLMKNNVQIGQVSQVVMGPAL